jgi:hypothetical protein
LFLSDVIKQILIMTKITMKLSDLRNLLDEQIKITANTIINSNCRYNKESTDGHQKSLNIDEEKFFQVASETKYPKDYLVLVKYLSEN